jgi:phosphatidylserine/phosphatidylglycerophosphate/cardiolipin synthase-like enzyme
MIANRAAARLLGEVLESSEARALAAHLASGETLSQDLSCIRLVDRPVVDSLLRSLGANLDDIGDREAVVMMLEAVDGAKSNVMRAVPIWTTPGVMAKRGSITAYTHETVLAAERSVVCSTFNIQRSSALWRALKAVLTKGVRVKIYIDTNAADTPGQNKGPSSEDVASELDGAQVFRTKELASGKRPRNHAKFVCVDDRTLIVTSANFSWSAEEANVELGLRIDDPATASLVLRQMEELEDVLYERI